MLAISRSHTYRHSQWSRALVSVILSIFQYFLGLKRYRGEKDQKNIHRTGVSYIIFCIFQNSYWAKHLHTYVGPSAQFFLNGMHMKYDGPNFLNILRRSPDIIAGSLTHQRDRRSFWRVMATEKVRSSIHLSDPLFTRKEKLFTGEWQSSMNLIEKWKVGPVFCASFLAILPNLIVWYESAETVHIVIISDKALVDNLVVNTVNICIDSSDGNRILLTRTLTAINLILINSMYFIWHKISSFASMYFEKKR